jgi:hypothetical protein
MFQTHRIGVVITLLVLVNGCTPSPDATTIPVALAVSPVGHSVSVQQGSDAPPDHAAVTVTGTDAASTSWTASESGTWLSLTGASGTGSGTLSWNRSTTGLAVGVYVDTITVTAAGVAAVSPARIYDTLRITAVPVPVTLAVSAHSGTASVQLGSSAPADSAMVTLSGTDAAATPWIATNRKPWITLVTSSGTGSGILRWTRTATALTVGTWVDTITVTAAGAGGSPIMIFDTLQIAAPPALSCATSAPTGQLTQVGGADAPFVYTTTAGWTITITKGQSIVAACASRNISWESWGSAGGSGGVFPLPSQHENINGTHIKDWHASHRTVLLPGGVKLTVSAFDHAIASGLYPVTRVSIYDGDHTYRIDAQQHVVVYSGAVPNFGEADEYDGATAQFVAEPTGWLFEERYAQAASTTGTPMPQVATVFPLARTYTAQPGRVDDYYDDT